MKKYDGLVKSPIYVVVDLKRRFAVLHTVVNKYGRVQEAADATFLTPDKPQKRTVMVHTNAFSAIATLHERLKS